MLIYLCRHAQKDYQDPKEPLSEEGRRQARALGKFLEGKKVSALYSSNLLRARETAQIVAQSLHLPITVDKRLRELECPRDEWTSYLKTLHPDLDYRIGGKESLNILMDRAKEVLFEIARNNREKEGDVVVIAHGTFIKGFLYTIGQQKYLLKDVPLTSAGIVILESVGEEFRLLKFSETRHLRYNKED
jgi:broad specificity phosphatase PhoE